MANTIALEAQPRERAGKGSSRAVRREGRVPAVIYGDNKEPVIISLETKEVLKELRRGTFFTTLCDLDLNGDKQRVLARDVQLHPVSDMPIHVDFLRVTPKTRIVVNVPVRFVGEDDSPGMREGGVLNVVRHEVEVYCRATDIPEELEVSLEGLEIGDTLHSGIIKLPEGVEFTITDREFALATLMAPRVMKAAAESAGGDEGEAAEGGEETAASEGEE